VLLCHNFRAVESQFADTNKSNFLHMSVPLDRLYNFLHDVCNHRDLIIYRFFPHGSRKITDLTVFLTNGLIDGSDQSWETRYQYARQNILFMHDQEPLNFDLYSSPDVFESVHPNFQIIYKNIKI
jgi:hypothetical protein